MTHYCITGGGSGLGLEVAKVLSGRGDEVTIIDKIFPPRAALENCKFVHHDLSFAFCHTITCDVLVLNHATFDGLKDFADMTEEYTCAYIRVNLLSHLELVRRVKYRRIVYINSVLSVTGMPKASLYSACKAFMRSLLESLRREGVPVTSVFPYKLNTPLFMEIRDIYTLDARYVAHAVVRAADRGRPSLFLPWIFRLSFLFPLLPTFLQDFLSIHTVSLLTRSKVRFSERFPQRDCLPGSSSCQAKKDL